jgi:hypothetical protein
MAQVNGSNEGRAIDSTGPGEFVDDSTYTPKAKPSEPTMPAAAPPAIPAEISNPPSN